MHPTLRQDLAATIIADRHREAETARAATRAGAPPAAPPRAPRRAGAAAGGRARPGSALTPRS